VQELSFNKIYSLLQEAYSNRDKPFAERCDKLIAEMVCNNNSVN
jgi:hypothetical protein